MAFVEAGLEIDPDNAKLTVERNIQKLIRGISASSKLSFGLTSYGYRLGHPEAWLYRRSFSRRGGWFVHLQDI
jgi:hypothetical protein